MASERVKLPEVDEDGWPLEIPWPTEGEWTTFVMCDGKRCCLSGWMHVAFSGHALGAWRDLLAQQLSNRIRRDPKRKAAAVAFQDALNAAAIARGFTGMIDFNNSERTSDADRTELWAEVAARFDYEAY